MSTHKHHAPAHEHITLRTCKRAVCFTHLCEDGHDSVANELVHKAAIGAERRQRKCQIGVDELHHFLHVPLVCVIQKRSDSLFKKKPCMLMCANV